MADVDDSPPTTADGPSLAVRCVRALLERHGLPKYRQSPWLADALGLSYSQAHRRLGGASPWSLEDLDRVGALFGESLAEVVALGQPSEAIAGVAKLGAATFDCRLWLGDRVDNPAPTQVVAVHTSSGWIAVCASEASEDTTYAISRMEASPSSSTRRTVAVLDDDRDLTNSICDHLAASGYEAHPFYRTADLQGSIETTRYDAFVIDWIVGESSTLKLIAELRGQSLAGPIVVLTAQVLSGVVGEEEIADAVAKHNLLFSEKPIRMAILSATLARALASASQAGPQSRA